MVDPATKRATYDDVLRAPEHKVAEVIDGVLHLSPRPGKPHTRASSTLGAFLEFPYDLAGWRRERMPVMTDELPYFDLAPDWICEVLSASTRRLDRAEKLPVYAREHVRHAWLIDPIARTLEVLRLDGERWVILATHAGDARVHAEPFDAIELELGLLWADVELPPESR